MPLKPAITKIQTIIAQAEQSYNRTPGSVQLLAVSKQQSIASIEEAYHCGLTHFGENYLQEALRKINQLQHLNLTWHFIGPIQSNKCKRIATSFDWVHSIDRLDIAELLNHYRTEDQPPLNVCIQVSLIQEANKSGIHQEQVHELVTAIMHTMPQLKLRGLMAIPPPQMEPQMQYETFLKLSQLMTHINKEQHVAMDTLSMGMSNDLIPAIKAGATIVRVGRAIFGARGE